MLTKLKLKTFQPSDLLNLLKYPLITEKTIKLYRDRRYTFIVDRCMDKLQIKKILEMLLQTKIAKINTCILPVRIRRIRRTSGKKPIYKKVYIQLQKGEKIPDLLR
jgi:large subunit ribosomal protein L23